MRIKLSDHFTLKRLLKFVFPSIIMMIIISIYGVIDGFFVSNYVGKSAFLSLNLVMPYNDIGWYGIYDWYWWQCFSIKNPRSKRK